METWAVETVVAKEYPFDHRQAGTAQDMMRTGEDLQAFLKALQGRHYKQAGGKACNSEQTEQMCGPYAPLHPFLSSHQTLLTAPVLQQSPPSKAHRVGN